MKGFEYKKCFFCGSRRVVKNGKQNGKQRYKCNDCGRRFDGGERLNSALLWRLYSEQKQTKTELAERFKCSHSTITRYLKKHIKNNNFPEPKNVILIMDTTYFGRKYGVMALFDARTKQTLSVDEVAYETNALYFEAVNKLKEKGVEIQSITCDLRQGLADLFPNIPVQLCQFHQIKNIRKYLTNKPKTMAGIALNAITLTLTKTNRNAFENELNQWFIKYKSFLNERTINAETGRSHYTHKRLRSAFFSLKRNLPYLFVFEDFPDLNIPNTTNLLENKFKQLKQKLGCHHGMNRQNKILFIKDFLSAR